VIRMPPAGRGYAPGMDPSDPAETRAVPLPEEVAAGDAGDRRDEAAEILRESEERVAEAAEGVAPGDAADEHRQSEDVV
jgi:hypothetical protein